SALFVSTDRGTSFVQLGTGLPPWTEHLAFDRFNPSVVYAAAGPDGLFRSVDGALTFERVAGLGNELLGGRGVIGVGIRPGDADKPSIIYASTSLGPVRSDDSGNTFVPIHDGFRATQVQDLAIDSAGRLLLATLNSLGVFRSAGPGTYELIGETLDRGVALTAPGRGPAPNDPHLHLIAGGGTSFFGRR